VSPVKYELGFYKSSNLDSFDVSKEFGSPRPVIMVALLSFANTENSHRYDTGLVCMSSQPCTHKARTLRRFPRVGRSTGQATGYTSVSARSPYRPMWMERIPVTDCGDLWGCEMLRILHSLDKRLTYGGGVCQSHAPAAFYSAKTVSCLRCCFLLMVEYVPGANAAGRIR
jgi:hypothetical protein